MMKRIALAVGIALMLVGSVFAINRAAKPIEPIAVANPREADVTSGWKTYASDECGVTFRYPADWTVSEDAETRIVLTKPNVDGGKTVPAPYDYDVALHCWANLKEAISQNAAGPLGTTAATLAEYVSANAETPTSVSGPKAVAGKTVVEQIVGGMGVIDQLWIERGGVYMLSFPDVADSTSLTADHQAILSSLSFTGTPVSQYDAESYWLQPTRLAVDGACVDRDANGAVVGLTKGCDDYGETQLPGGMRVRFLPDSTDKNRVQLAFFDGPNEWTASRLTLSVDESTNLSDLSVNVVGVYGAWIYVEDSNGHEAGTRSFVYGPTGWHSLNVWDALKATFPDTMAPSFSIRLSANANGDLLVTEQNGIGGPSYSELPESLRLERSESRRRYVLKMTGDIGGVPTFDVVRTERIPR